MRLELLAELARPAETKILLVVLDGLGGLGRERGDPTPLEVADTPNLDRLAREGICGLHEPVGPGITPGSGPGHLALFGYDPLTYRVGRGALTALGIDFDLRPGDVAARGNFCTLDGSGRVTDRRAGRPPTERSRALCERMREAITLDGAELFVEPVADHRFLLVLRGDDLDPRVDDTDPQRTGLPPLDPEARDPAAERTAGLVARFVAQAHEALAEEAPTNGVLLRGFASRPDWPLLPDVTAMRMACVAKYPMYRGVSRLLGMEVLELGGEAFPDRVEAARDAWDRFDFLFVHAKQPDSTAEDGDFDAKAEAIEAVDAALPPLLDLQPDVVVVTGDHSTAARLARHTWHPVPVLIRSETCRPDDVRAFSELACLRGALGPRLPGHDLMALAMGHALRLRKFGA